MFGAKGMDEIEDLKRLGWCLKTEELIQESQGALKEGKKSAKFLVLA